MASSPASSSDDARRALPAFFIGNIFLREETESLGAGSQGVVPGSTSKQQMVLGAAGVNSPLNARGSRQDVIIGAQAEGAVPVHHDGGGPTHAEMKIMDSTISVRLSPNEA